MTFAEIKKKLQHKTIGIAGAGGLGSNCAVALARIGIGRLIIADYDIIEESNLNRQYYFIEQIGKKKVDALKENIFKINPEVAVDTSNKKLDTENIQVLFQHCAVIVEALDTSQMKKMFIETVLEFFPETPLVSGQGMSGTGMNDTIHCSRYDQLYICGDEKTEASSENPPLAPRVGIVANMQANTVLEILLKSV